MTLVRRLSLRARLALALVGVAALAVGLATWLVSRGVHDLVVDAAQSRLERSAEHLAAAAAAYRKDRGWTPGAREALTHLGLANRLDVAPVRSASRTGEPSATADVVVDSRVVDRIVVRPVDGKLLNPEETELEASVRRLTLVAGGAAAAAALALAFFLAHTISGPRRRIRAIAERLRRGELSARVEPSGDPESREVAETLNRLAETLEQHERLRGQMVADLAHELRTPVNALLSRIEAAQDRVLADDEANLVAMHAETLRLARLLDDLAQLAEAERPGLLVGKRPLDLADLASAEARNFEPRFTEKRISFATGLEPVPVNGDPDRLGQIISNLLANALRYTEPGGRVRLRIRRTGEHAVLEVSDTGVGIAPEDVGHVFERFWRGDRSRSRVTGGAGIGLAIVEQLVRAHEGRIEVESEPGRGSTFRVLLPVAARGELPPSPGRGERAIQPA